MSLIKMQVCTFVKQVTWQYEKHEQERKIKQTPITLILKNVEYVRSVMAVKKKEQKVKHIQFQ